MLNRAVTLHDIEDAEAFVRKALSKSKIRLVKGTEENEELVAEGLALLCEMAGRYRARLDGYNQDGSFAGWAARYLPHRLNDAYFALHPEHVLRTQADGRRRYTFGRPPESLQAVMEVNPSAHDTDRIRTVGEFVPDDAPQRAA